MGREVYGTDFPRRTGAGAQDSLHQTNERRTKETHGSHRVSHMSGLSKKTSYESQSVLPMSNATHRVVYFLVKYIGTGRDTFTAFIQGTNPFTISELHRCHIMRYYPQPSVNLTPWFRLFQRRIRLRLRRHRWLRHPLRLRHRELWGSFPPFPRELEE